MTPLENVHQALSGGAGKERGGGGGPWLNHGMSMRPYDQDCRWPVEHRHFQERDGCKTYKMEFLPYPTAFRGHIKRLPVVPHYAPPPISSPALQS